MKNIKKIFALLILSILFQTKNVKPVSKKAVEQVHALTSLITILHNVLPSWRPEIKEHPRWHNLEFPIPISEKVSGFFNEKTNINLENVNRNFYAPAIINQIIAASIDLDLDFNSELIENFKRIKNLFQNMNNLPPELKTGYERIEIFITTSEIVTKSLSKVIVSELLENHKIYKRLSKIILLTGFDVGGNCLRHYFNKQIKEILPDHATVVINSLVKNIVIEVFGEIIQRLFIDNEKTKKQKYLHKQIDNMMKNNELVLKLKNSNIETKPIEIK